MLIVCTILSHSSDTSSSTGVPHCPITSRTSTAFEVVPGDHISGLFSMAVAAGYLDTASGPCIHFPGQY